MHFKELMKIYNVKPPGILHVGAHYAEENAEYPEIGLQGLGEIFWVEAQSELAKLITQKLVLTKNRIINAVVWDQIDIKFAFDITSKIILSSLFDFETNTEKYPDIIVTEKRKVRTLKLDLFLKNKIFFQRVVLDIQKVKLQALKRLNFFISQVNRIFTEVSKSQLYKNSSLVGDMDTFLETLDFIQVFTEWNRRAGWDDAPYVRRCVFHQSFKQKIFSKLSKLSKLLRSFCPNRHFQSWFILSAS